MPILSNQTIPVCVGFRSPWTDVQSLLLVDPTVERRQLIWRQEAALPLHNSHMELEPSQRLDTSTSLDEGAQGPTDGVVVSLGPEVVNLASERRVRRAPVNDRERLVELVGGFLPRTPPSQVERALLWIWFLRTGPLRVLLEVCPIPIFNTLELTIKSGMYVGRGGRTSWSRVTASCLSRSGVASGSL